jgi:hypothetical protein
MALSSAEAEVLNEETPAGDVADAPASGEQEAAPDAPTEETPSEGEAPAEGEGEAEGDPKPEVAKTEKPEDAKQKWKAVEAAKKEQIKLSGMRRELAHREQRIQQFEQHLDTRTKDLDARESRVQRLEKALSSRDLGELVDLGFDYEGFTRRELERSTPDGRAKLALEEAQRIRDELEKKDKDRDARERAQAQIQETRRIAHRLVELVDESADEMPDLYQWAPERIANEGIELRDLFVQRYGKHPTYEQVMTELQRRAKAEADVRTQRVTTLEQRKSGKTSDAGGAGKADNTKGASGSPGTPALSAKTAAERPSPTREKTEAEIDAECLAELRALRR